MTNVTFPQGFPDGEGAIHIMLSDSERRRLAELEARLRADDPAFAAGFTGDRHLSRVRRIAGGCLAAVGVIAGVLGLIFGSILTVVVSLCVIGVAAGILLPPT